MIQKVRTSLINDTAVTGNKIPTAAISTNNIVVRAITGNLLAANSVSSNNIVPGSITGNLLTTNVIGGNNIVPSTITGNLLATTSVSSNNLTPNLSLSVIRTLEVANVYTTPVGNTVNIDALNNTVYFFSSNTTSNVTFNLRGNNTTTFENAFGYGETVNLAILLKQGSTRYKANVQVDGTIQAPYWIGNSAPDYATSVAQSIDIYSFTVIKTGPSAFTILASNTNFGLATGQPGQG